MDLPLTLSLLTHFDTAALAFLLVAWYGIGWRIEHPSAKHPSVTVQMAGYRREWMRQFITRENRIFDAQIIGSLRQGTSFFASTSIFALGGTLALIGNPTPLASVAGQLGQTVAPALLWQLKLVAVVLFLTHAFLKFVWSHRVFGYCMVMMAAVPNDPKDPASELRTKQAAELNIRAAWNFNRGLRSMYFALGTLAWLLGPAPLVLATLAVLCLLWVREFSSVPHAVLSQEKME
ncbi:MAG: DUF599 domain-containing protein [Rhodobacteraceae bacterium]|nr:DUF599 domain-containing protein [Paracoccaceae bacterium]